MNPEHVIAKVRHAFQAADLKIPKIIILADPEEGWKIMLALARPSYAEPPAYVLEGTTEYMQLKIAGVRVRWPCTKVALPGGKIELR